MNAMRPNPNTLPRIWALRPRDGQPPRLALPPRAPAGEKARPGIAARWKPRDRVGGPGA